MKKVQVYSLFSGFDIELFKSGKHFRLFEKLGSHVVEVDGVKGVYFAVWAPNAKSVSVIADFNNWDCSFHVLNVRWDSSGIWEGFIPDIGEGCLYKYHIRSNFNEVVTQKADPFARLAQTPPETASVVTASFYKFKDKKWLKKRHSSKILNQPMSIYEVHLASWKKYHENRFTSYIELAQELVKYVKEMQFTHVEFLPIMEYPYDPSWGYQITGYFAPTSRFGDPDELKFLIDLFHQNDIGVLLDWVPSHFPEDAHGLGFFDGTNLYEHPDRRKGYHPDWKSLVFNYGRNEVRAFLISNAMYWLEEFHFDGIRTDAVASILFLDYSRNEGEWETNIYGGNTNLEAISFLQELNITIHQNFPGIISIAEESTTFPDVSRSVETGGLGFDMKWMMGWMNDTLAYFKRDPIYRKYHQNDLTFSINYAFTENFVLPLSHDEVVHGKSSLLGKMPGDEWQRFANLRLLFGYMFTHPGTKLLFMGGELALYNEWNFASELDWNLLQYDYHRGMKKLVQDLNILYKNEKSLYQKQFEQSGFEWIDISDHQHAVISYCRRGNSKNEMIIVVCNFTPVVRHQYRIGIPKKGTLTEIINTDDEKYGGSGVCNRPKIEIEKIPYHNKQFSAEIIFPPLGMCCFKII